MLIPLMALYLGLGLIWSPWLQADDSSLAGLGLEQFVFAAGEVPEQVREAIVKTANARPAYLWPAALGFVVGVFYQEEDWGLGSLAPADSLGPDWGQAQWFLAHRDQGFWQVALQGSPEFMELLSASPEGLISSSDRALLGRPSLDALAGPSQGLKFPWSHLEIWLYSSSWHQGTAMDFAPYAGSSRMVLAASDGVVRLLCDDAQQAALRLENAGCGNTSYVHLRSGSVPKEVVGQAVFQGRPLGFLYEGSTGSGWYSLDRWPLSGCNPDSSPQCDWNTRSGCCYLRFNTPCGYGTGPHLHWELPSRSVIVDGWSSREDGCWVKAGEARCMGADFASSNVPATPLVIRFPLIMCLAS